MARTHGSRLTQLEEACMRFILKAERLELANERLKARIEKLEAQGQTKVPIVRLSDLERAR